MPSSAVACKKRDMVNQRLKAPEPKAKLRCGKQGGSTHRGETKKKLAQAVSKGVAIAVGEPKMEEIGAEVAAEVDADVRLRPSFAQEAPLAIPLGMEERLKLSLAALLLSIE